MLLNQLSISYKCQSSIGNSLKLNEMMNEVLKTFTEETEAVYGGFYLTQNDSKEEISSIGKRIDYDISSLYKKTIKDKINICRYDESLNSLLYRLENGLIVFVYDESIDLDFIKLIFESLRKKLNVSINSCLNVKDLENKNQKLNQLTSNLQIEVSKAVELNKKKDKQMFEQMKMAQMGELIGNIAHQWRQPLSVISTVASGMKLKKELDLLSKEDFLDYADRIVDNAHVLSTTIDEFRDYIKESHRQKDVIIQERVKMALKIIEPSYDSEHIEIIENFIELEPIYFRLISGELLQVLISILSNAKEALIEKEIEKKWIKYSIKKDTYKIFITIEDNAGGIPSDIMAKIFNPYFTTKHQNHGTGIGLYNSYNIVKNHLKGNLYARNTEEGVKFVIELPVNMDYAL